MLAAGHIHAPPSRPQEAEIMRLSPQDLASRRALDFRVVNKMNTDCYQFSAHRTPQDATTHRNSITDARDARYALHYRARYRIKTLTGPGEYSAYTTIRLDVSSAGYPFSEPVSWVVEEGESQLPYSPHFARNRPICLGSVWRSDGQVLLGHCLIHLARLLNWDETIESGHHGYNRDAVVWWWEHLRHPLTPGQIYPVLPSDEAYGLAMPERGGFRRLQPRGRFERARGT